MWKPAAELSSLWTLLRVATLHAVWHCRSWREELVGSFAAAAVSRIVDFLQTSIERDWLRASMDVRLLSELPADYFRGRDPQLATEDFAARWTPNSVLCSIVSGSLVVHISLQAPVPVPV